MQEPGLVQQLLDLVAAHHAGLGPLVLFLSSLVEYVFPPFPGDVITLFGTYLVVRGLWSWPFALGLTLAGSLVGALIDYAIGAWLGRRIDRLPSEAGRRRFRFLTREKFELLQARFRRFGPAYVAVNRFLPGIRAFFLVAAGAARMPLWQVLFYASLSALAWNGLLLGVGLAVGENWERLRSLFSSYTAGVWIVLGAVAIGIVGVWLVRRRRRRAAEASGRSEGI